MLERWGHTVVSRRRLIAAAALLAAVIGVGMAAGISLDATLIRALLVPATMRLPGRWNWWAPGPLGRLHRRAGLEPSAGAAQAQQPALVD